MLRGRSRAVERWLVQFTCMLADDGFKLSMPLFLPAHIRLTPIQSLNHFALQMAPHYAQLPRLGFALASRL